MKSVTKDKVYKSPLKKLAHFFEKSRDHWKREAQEAREKLKAYEEETQKKQSIQKTSEKDHVTINTQ